MERLYSSSSVVFSRFPACLGAVHGSFGDREVHIGKPGLPKRFDAIVGEIDVKSLSEGSFPIMICLSKADTPTIEIEFKFVWTIFIVSVSGAPERDIIELHDLIRDSLALKELTKEDERGVASLSNINENVWRIHDMVKMLLERSTESNGEVTSQLSCFVSYRFDDHSKSLALDLREFLELVGVNCISGSGFEPRPVSEKVIDRLSQPLDLFIVILSSSGDSAWLNQEIGVARGKDLPVLVLREEGCIFDQGLLGDIEYLTFPKDNISKSFVGVLQAISYVRQNVANKLLNRFGGKEHPSPA